MSYIGAGTLTGVKPQDMAMSYTDPTRPNQQNSRGLRLITGPTSGYDLIFPFQTIKAKYSQGTHSTNLELFDWVVEISGIIWYKPTATDRKPSKLQRNLCLTILNTCILRCYSLTRLNILLKLLHESYPEAAENNKKADIS